MQLATRPDSYENPENSTVDPYGNSDFFCKLCHKELSNVYYQCYGCYVILSKDFRICQDCHDEKKYYVHIQMHNSNNFKDSRVNHNGKLLERIVPFRAEDYTEFLIALFFLFGM